nr:MAG TPA: hypothetical protein [Bacteriophage sp.]
MSSFASVFITVSPIPLITITRTSGYMGIGMLTFSVVCHDSPSILIFRARFVLYTQFNTAI